MKRAQREVQWSKHIEGWKTSGLTQRRYCERESISYDTFKRWRQRLGTDRGLRSGAPRLVPVRVAPVNVAQSMPTDPTLTTSRAARYRGTEIWLSSGRAIALGRELDEVELGRLIRLLEMLPC